MAAEWRVQEQMLQTVAHALGTRTQCSHRHFAYAVQSAAHQQPAREELIFQRLEALAVPPAQP